MDIPESNPSKKCIACAGILQNFGTRGPYTYAQCTDCGTLQLSPIPTEEELARAYAEDYAESGHQGTDAEAIFEASSPFYKSIINELKRASIPAGAVLDFGCGWGGMCRYLRNHGYDYLGIDFESESLKHCRKLMLNVQAKSLSVLAQEETRYSAILLVTVFEHLNNHAQVLKQIKKLLKPNGVLIILIPTATMFGFLARVKQIISLSSELPELHSAFCPPWHTAIFSIKGVRNLVERNGFVVEWVTASPSGKSKGFIRLVQISATFLARAGFMIFGERWPLVFNHIFVCRTD